MVIFVVVLALLFVEFNLRSTKSSIEVESKAFENGGRIPKVYTCGGRDISPPLSWSKVNGAMSYVVIVEDPDAPGGTFIHWVLYNIPAEVTSLPENLPKKAVTEYGYQGVNDFGRVGYGGPCPPPGKAHRYVFHVYALDSKLSLNPGATASQVLYAMQGHVIAEGSITGLYGRG